MNRSWFAGACGLVILALVSRLIRGPREEPATPPRPSVGAAPQRPLSESRRIPAQDSGNTDRALADALHGYWRGETINGVTTSFRFDATGDFACIVDQEVAGRAPVIHGGAAGEWWVERGQLLVRWITTDSPSMQPLIGRTARTTVQFQGKEWVHLAGVEGDDIARTYRRAY